jgi:hypothetical protein
LYLDDLLFGNVHLEQCNTAVQHSSTVQPLPYLLAEAPQLLACTFAAHRIRLQVLWTHSCSAEAAKVAAHSVGMLYCIYNGLLQTAVYDYICCLHVATVELDVPVGEQQPGLRP